MLPFSKIKKVVVNLSYKNIKSDNILSPRQSNRERYAWFIPFKISKISTSRLFKKKTLIEYTKLSKEKVCC